MKPIIHSNTNKSAFAPKIKIRIVRVKDNITFNVIGYKKAVELTNVSVDKIRYNMNRDDKITNGYKFYDW